MGQVPFTVRIWGFFLVPVCVWFAFLLFPNGESARSSMVHGTLATVRVWALICCVHLSVRKWALPVSVRAPTIGCVCAHSLMGNTRLRMGNAHSCMGNPRSCMGHARSVKSVVSCSEVWGGKYSIKWPKVTTQEV